MFHVQGATRQTCNLLAVLSLSNAEYKQNQSVTEDNPKYPFPDIVSSGRLEVQVLRNPSIDEIRKALDSSQANLVYFQGEQLSNGDISALIWDTEAVSGLFQTHLPTTVYLEIPNGEKLAEALHTKGIPYVIYWKNTFTCYTASHFRHTLFSVIQSSSCHTWDAFELAHASFRLYCITNNVTLGPLLLGDPPKINVTLPNTVTEDDNNESSSEDLSAIKIYDEDVTIKFLICGASKTLDESLLESLEDGLNALLSIEMRGSKLHNRVSAVPPPLQAGVFSRGVVTMRCDMSTTTSSHISLLVSGNAQTCFDDQLLENHIKREIIEKSKLTHALSNSEENITPLSEPRRSVSIACGASVFEVSLKIPTWASQILRQLAPDTSYRSLVMLGIASIQGLSVAAFEKNDAERFLFFCKTQGHLRNLHLQVPPIWLKPPVPSKNEGILPARKKLKSAALKPIPHIHQRKMLPFSSVLEINGVEKNHVALNTSIKHNTVTSSNNITHRKSVSGSYQANKQTISLNPLPLKKHGCDRKPIHVCSEDEFLKDVMQFLILRGHNRLIPQGGLAEFPDAILNAKRLDLFNLYREVVSRGGFHVGNGINWKGQVFSKMSNHTVTNRMTGVGNTLKRHYETYLLEYELAHDDVDGECCLLCHSSAAGDWVNCGICGEWAHFGCDRRQGLGAFKDYAKTDGLEYICPQCSVTNFKKKTQKTTNGYS